MLYNSLSAKISTDEKGLCDGERVRFHFKLSTVAGLMLFSAASLAPCCLLFLAKKTARLKLVCVSIRQLIANSLCEEANV